MSNQMIRNTYKQPEYNLVSAIESGDAAMRNPNKDNSLKSLTKPPCKVIRKNQPNMELMANMINNLYYHSNNKSVNMESA